MTQDRKLKEAQGDAAAPAVQDQPGRTPAPDSEKTLSSDVARQQRAWLSRRNQVAVAIMVVSVVTVAAFSIQRIAGGAGKVSAADARDGRDPPAAATAQPHLLDMGPATPTAKAGAASTPGIPPLLPSDGDSAEPIAVRRTGASLPEAGSRETLAQDAPVLLVSTRPGALPVAAAAHAAPLGAKDDARAGAQASPQDDTIDETSRNLKRYQRQLQGLLDGLAQGAALTSDTGHGGAAAAPAEGPAPGAKASRVVASVLGNRSLTLPQGTSFTCALTTRVISAASGHVGCRVQRNVFSDDGRVLLIERGSEIQGEYRISFLRPGSVRIPVLWTRIRTPLGVSVDIASPGTGALGESGIDGHVDNRWSERIGAAMLLSLIDDSVKLVIQNQANERQADTIVLPSTTSNTSKLAEKVLDSTINIPPLIYRNQGGIVGIYVARDVDFSSVYELRPSVAGPRREATR